MALNIYLKCSIGYFENLAIKFISKYCGAKLATVIERYLWHTAIAIGTSLRMLDFAIKSRGGGDAYFDNIKK